jgi:lysophospholipase L1-like esterase
LSGRGARALLLAFSTLLSLVAAEVFCRLRFPPPIPAPPAPREVFPYSGNPFVVLARPWFHFHIPGSRYTQVHPAYRVEYRINSDGFRGAEIGPKRRARRLVVAGDSMVEGQGVREDETFSALLDTALSPDGLEVVNAGMQGYGLSSLALNEPRYAALSPDAVLVTVFDNDVTDDRYHERDYFGRPYLECPELLLHGATPLCAFSRFAGKLEQLVRARRRTPVERRILANLAAMRELRVALSHRKNARDESLFLTREFWSGQWDLSRTYLDALRGELSARRIRMLVLSLNFWHLRRVDFHDRWSAPGAVEDPHADAVDVERSRLISQASALGVEEWGRKNGVAVFPTAGFFTELDRERGLSAIIIERDGHLTAAAHRALAERLAPWLKQVL